MIEYKGIVRDGNKVYAFLEFLKIYIFKQIILPLKK